MKRATSCRNVYQPPAPWAMARIATVLCVTAWASITPAMAGAGAVASTPEAGLWIDDEGKGAVDIAPCGPKLCGRIVWLRDPLDPKGKPQIDSLNPQANKRGLPVCGLQVIGALARQSDGSWDQGWVYDPKVGESYDVAIQLKDANHLVVTGYQGLKLFSKKFVWTRAPADKPLARCAG